MAQNQRPEQTEYADAAEEPGSRFDAHTAGQLERAAVQVVRVAQSVCAQAEGGFSDLS